MYDLPKLLVVSNNCFSMASSNGRILSELLSGYPKERLAQFYIKEGSPELEICRNYYFVSDTDALGSLKGRDCGRVVTEAQPALEKSGSGNNKAPGKKGVAARIARNWVWRLGRWQNRRFREWLESFGPECVLLQSGDSVFMIRLAHQIAESRGIPLIVFNSEDYYFKDENYLDRGFFADFLYRFYIGNYRRHFNRMIAYAATSVYMCNSLKELYDSRFHMPGSVIMSSTELTPDPEKCEHEPEDFVFSYLGNLGLRRYEALCEIGSALQQIDPGYRLDVYGRIGSEKCREAFDKCSGIRYKGFVDYDTVVSVMKASDFLFHAECFDEEIVKNIRNAFSTKIADSLACGSCFVFYGDASIEGARYLTQNDCACVITEPRQLTEKLERLIRDGELRKRYTDNALRTAEKNHRADKNRDKMERIIHESVTGQLRIQQ